MNHDKDSFQKSSFLAQWMLSGIAVFGIVTVIFSSIEAIAQPQLDAQTQQAMIEAIQDEYRARAFYNAVLQKFGDVRPFSNIVKAENNHVQLWNALFAQYEISVPPDTFAGNVQVPETFKAACEAGVENEVANVQMYDRFLQFVKPADLRAAFTRLRQVSQERHLPAFQRCQSQGRGYRGQNF